MILGLREFHYLVSCCKIMLPLKMSFLWDSEPTMEELDVTNVDLGFMERDFDSWETQSRHFPSKIGGGPLQRNMT